MFRMFIYVGFCFVVAVPWMVGVRTVHQYIFGDRQLSNSNTAIAFAKFCRNCGKPV